MANETVQGVEVKLGAQTQEVKTEMSGAADSIKASLDEMTKALKAFTDMNAKTTSEVAESSKSMAHSFSELRAKAAEVYGGMTENLEKFRIIMDAALVAVTGGGIWGKSVEEMLHFEQEVRNLEMVLNLSADAATKLSLALTIIGSNSEQYTGIALKMGREIKSGGEEMTRLGVAFKDGQGNLLPMNQIMENAFARMQTFKAGTDQAEFALSIFGKSAMQVYDIMARLPAAQERVTELQKLLGIEMGEGRQRDIEQYRLDLGAFKVILGDVEDKIGEAVLPQLQNLAKWFNRDGPAAAEILINAIKFILAAFTTLTSVVRIVIHNIIAAWEDLVLHVERATEVISAVVSGRWNEIGGILDRKNKEIVANQKRAADEVLSIWTQLGDSLGALFDENYKAKHSDKEPPPFKSGTNTFTPKPKKDTQDKSDMPGFEAALKAQEDAYNQAKLDQGSFETWSVEMTKNYWAKIRDENALSAKDRLAVDGKYYDARRELEKNAFQATIAGLEAEKASFKYNYDERIKIAQEEYRLEAQRWGAGSQQAIEAMRRVTAEYQAQAKQREQIDAINTKMVESTAAYEYTRKAASAQQELALGKITKAQLIQIEMDYLAEKWRIDAAAVQAQLDDPNNQDNPVKYAQLKAQQLAIDQQYQTAKTKLVQEAELEQQKYAMQAEQAVQSATATLFDDLVSRTKTLHQTLLDFVNSITSALNKIAANMLSQQLMGSGSAGGGILSQIMSAIFGAGGGGGVASYAVGSSYIPRDQLAIVHEGEAVIPKAQNRGGLGGVQVHNHFAITGPVDTRTQDQIAAKAAQSINRASYRNL